MLTLFQTPPAWGLPNFSPFCLKIETYLRMVGIEYQVEIANVRKAPKGKVPWIEDDGAIIADSSMIIDHLKARHGDPLDGGLDDAQRAQALLIQRTIEEHLYFALAYFRWSSPAAWPHIKAAFAASQVVPKMLLAVILPAVRKQVIKVCHGQGISRHSRADVLERVRRDFDAVSCLLGDKPYVFGDEPSSVDAILYGFLPQILYVPWDSQEKDLLGTYDNLVAHCERVKERYFGDSDS